MQAFDVKLRVLGISQRELARESGLRSQSINYISKGGGCRLDTFLQLRAALRRHGYHLDPEELASLAYQKGDTDPQKRLRETQSARGAAS